MTTTPRNRRRTAPLLLVLALWVLALAGTTVPAGAQVGTSRDLLNPNLATEEELLAVPGLDEELVAGILENRPFLGMESLHALLGAARSVEELEALYRRLWVPIDLNSAAEVEILAIPGVGERMLHEFLEYRPYRALAEFRREIGKYVDDDEVTRLEQYVFVPIDLNSASEADILSIPGVGERMLHEFLEYRPYRALAEFHREIGKYVDDDEVARLARYVTVP